MANDEIAQTLRQVSQSEYPLQVGKEEAKAMLQCADHIMKAVPDETRPSVRDAYNTLTSAIWHPAA